MVEVRKHRWVGVTDVWGGQAGQLPDVGQSPAGLLPGVVQGGVFGDRHFFGRDSSRAQSSVLGVERITQFPSQ